MLRRNLLKSILAIIPISLLSKNVAHNENADYVTETTVKIKTKSGKPIRIDRSDGYWCEYTYDKNENELSYKDSFGFYSKSTYDQNGNQLTYKDSKGSWFEKTYNEKGQISSYKDNDGLVTYDKHGIKNITPNS